MCGGKKEPEKKGEPLPEPPPEGAPPPTPPEEGAPPPPAEEPKGSTSAAKGSMFGSESKLAQNTKSLALMSTVGKKGGGGFAKAPAAKGGESMMGGGKNTSLALTTVRGAEPKGAKSQAFGNKSAVKAKK